MQTLNDRLRGSSPDEAGYRRRVIVGLSICALQIFVILGWATVATLSSAVIAPGQVVIETSVKKVQHPTGGVVGDILVRNGDRVDPGQVLLRLDETQTRANLGVVVSQMTELTGRKARLAAERDGATEIAFPHGFAQGDEASQRVAAGERRLFDANRRSIEGQKAQLLERIGQFKSEIDGLSRQEKSKSKELALINEELDRLEQMYSQKLVPVTRVLSIQRDVMRIEGEHGQLLAQIARASGQITETRLKIIELEETMRANAQKELREIEAKLAELEERRVAAQDMLKRVDLRAPQGGIVHELAVQTVGGVINAGDVLMSIVPDEDRKAIEVHLSPTDIDQVTIGQNVKLRFPAFNQRTTPELTGSVAQVAADVTRNKETGASFYTARIKISDADLAEFNKLKLVAGMPVESFIQTGSRTALSYFVKPFTDQVERAFQEE
ncbi:MAG: HlyD family type I secretion periplasmic adaptor subunit [Hyphomicrobium sp.]